MKKTLKQNDIDIIIPKGLSHLSPTAITKTVKMGQ